MGIKNYCKSKRALDDAMKYSGLDDTILNDVVFDGVQIKYDPTGSLGTAVAKTDLLTNLNYC